MMMGMTADAHMAKFHMLAGMTGYKVYSQTSLPSGLDNWKAVVCNLDHLHRGFAELKQSICPLLSFCEYATSQRLSSDHSILFYLLYLLLTLHSSELRWAERVQVSYSLLLSLVT